jgi:hypothetical protein
MGEGYSSSCSAVVSESVISAGGPMIEYRSEAQSPRSAILHRSLQKGNDRPLVRKASRQVGQVYPEGVVIISGDPNTGSEYSAQ